jgi:peptidoglycan/xylan/chitin deacetylase (PgdA/CDA1 family)
MIFPLNNDPSQNRDFQQAPVLYSSVNTRIETVLWLHDGTLLLFLRNRRDNTGQVLTYKDGKDQGFRELASGDIFGLSSDSGGMQFALLRSGSVEIYNTASLTVLKTLIHHRSLAFYWRSDSYISAGRDTIRRINTDSGVSENIGLSQISQAGFSLTGELYGQCEDLWYKYNEALSWLPQKSRVELGPSNLSNTEYRIYLEEKRGGWFGSSLKIRNIEGYKTSDFLPLYSGAQTRNVSLQHKRDAGSNPWYFDHGAPTDKNEIALVLNAVDTAEAVPEVLRILEQYKIPATIFINGDFIHANPGETSLIAESGHRVGSLFYTYFDMSDPEYQLDKTFLKKGLARNEDDYFIATGKEMDMLWHTPFYTINAAILDISASMEYVFIGTDIPVYDRLNLRNPVDSSRFDVVDQALQLLNRVKPGSIIPLTLGKNQSQDEYLFLVLPMIIEELLRQGYEFVDLQEMMKSSR